MRCKLTMAAQRGQIVLTATLAIAAILATSSCGPSNLVMKQEEVLGHADAATVEVDMFSGLPNPTWSLVSEEVAHLVESIDKLEPTTQQESPGWLGYRGIRFHLFTRGREIASAENFAEHLSLHGAAGTSHLADPGSKLERWLLSTGQGKIEADVYEACRTEAESFWTRKKEP